MNLVIFSKMLFVLGGLAGALPIDARSRHGNLRASTAISCVPAKADIPLTIMTGKNINTERNMSRKKKSVSATRKAEKQEYEDLTKYLPVH